MRNILPILPLTIGFILLSASVHAQSLATIRIDPSHELHPISRDLTGVCLEDVNHEIYGGLYSQMIFGESFQEPAVKNKVTGASDGDMDVSGMWRIFRRKDALGAAAIVKTRVFVGTQSQGITFSAGAGEFGIENQGLNREGLGLVANRIYQGHLWARSETPIPILISLASADGTREYSTAQLFIQDGEWHRYDFTLTPNATDSHGRFEIGLTSPGSIVLGYVFLEPGPWGLFKSLPVRRDVAEALIDEGITAIRYGGSMANAQGYRWKNMIGDHDRRPPYRGWWYEQSSNGWGIPDFLNFCEAANVLAIPDFNINESPADMVDFLEYANGPSESVWGARRVADGHPAPYHLTHIELGNEERVDNQYYTKFKALAEAIWAKDPGMILTVGDFGYGQPIVDPMHVTGAFSGIMTLLAHKQILDLARRFNSEVWFDIHLGTDSVATSAGLDAFPTYIDAIDQLASGAKHKVAVFELNANNHGQQRALADAQALIRLERDGRVPFVSSANCLQVDLQNNNGWDQGLLFMNPSVVWLQPPGYALQMFARNYEPSFVDCTVIGGGNLLAAATLSDDHRTVVVQVLNAGEVEANAEILLKGWQSGDSHLLMETLAAPLGAVNTASNRDAVRTTTLAAESGESGNRCYFPPHSFTIIRISRN